LVIAASLLAFAVGTPAASAASKTVIAEIGNVSGDNSAAGGLFNTPRGIAVNQTGSGGVARGTFYVFDRVNARIQQFLPSGKFVRTWGVGVLSGNAVFESCSLAAECEPGISSAIAGGLSNRTSGSDAPGIAVDQSTGIVYVSDPGNQRISVFTASGNFQGAFGYAVQANAPAAELQFCTSATGCTAGSSGGLGGQLGGTATVFGNVAVAPLGSPHAGDVFLADRGNLRVDQFKPTLEFGVVTDVSFVRAFGRDVVTTGKPNNVSTTAFEVCDTTNGNVPADCKSGTSGTDAGSFGALSPSDVAVDSEGNVLALDVANKRIQKFSSAPAPINKDFGGPAIATTFGTAANLLQNIAIDASATPNHLLVSGKRTTAGNRIAVLELDSTGGSVDVHGTDLTSTEGTGLAVAPAALAGHIYVATKIPNRVFVLGEQATPTIEPATGQTSTSAMLHGQVVSNNAETAYRFEYSADGGKNWTKLPAVDVVVPPAAGNVAVSQEATNLLPNTKYVYRLVALRPMGGFGFTSAPESFTTSTSPPAVPDVSVVDVNDSSARLVGQVNPNSLATTYFFEYGTTPAFGSTTPIASAGDGSSLETFSQVVAGLIPGTTYHFQLVAENSAGATTSPTRTFTTRSDPMPAAAQRAVEMVSPSDKNFGPADGSGNPKPIGSWDGEAVAFCTSAQFGDDPPGQSTPCSSYVSRRSASGWRTEGVWGAYCTHDPSQSFPTSGLTEVTGSAPNLDLAVFQIPESNSCQVPPLDPSAPLGTNLYRADFTAEPTAYSLLSPKAAATPQFLSNTGFYAGASDDFGHIAFTSKNLQTDDAVGTAEKVFEWDNGDWRLVSVKPDGSPFTTASAIPYAGEFGSSDGVNVVSSDGSRIFFQNEYPSLNECTVAACRVYMREDGTTTHFISQSECTGTCLTSGGDSFEWATPSGDKAFFRSASQLTNDDTSTTGRDLYLYTQSANPAADQNLTLLSKDNEPTGGVSAEVLGAIGVSDDGNTVFFVASGQIVAGAPTAAGPKIYRWRWNGGSPSVDYLATLASGPRDEQNWSAREPGEANNVPPAQLVTPSGTELLIQTLQPLIAERDHDSDLDVYNWDEEGGWTCISCQALGTPSAGESSYDAKIFRNGNVMKRPGKELRIVRSDDGARVFFSSRDPLVPRDANGEQDVYEWHDGAINLVSSGSGKGASFLGASRSGRDVFFFTTERLVGWDTDPFSDIYDARIGGGFPEPPTEVPCVGDACQGAQSQPPVAVQPASVNPSSGNAPSGRKPRRCARGGHKARHGKSRPGRAKAGQAKAGQSKKKVRNCKRRRAS
jgi:hypothetical protein